MVPFQGFATFLKSRIGDLTADMGFVGIPYDGSTSFRAGARFGPNAVRAASMMLTDGDHPVFETSPAAVMTDLGDIETRLDINLTLSSIERYILEHPFAGTKPLFFVGGDHSVTLGVLRGFRRQSPIVIHFDAHCDTWADHFGEPIGHGTWVRNAVEEGLIPAKNILSVGMRSPVDPATRDWLVENGGTTLTTRQAIRLGPENIAKTISAFIGARPWYLTFDIDVLDPAYAPGTGTPEIAGLAPHFVLEVLESLSPSFQNHFLGMDVVEVNPPYDPTQTTALAAATIIWSVAAACLAK